MKTALMESTRAPSLSSDIAVLVKSRLTFLVLITTFVGFLVAWRGPMDFLLLAYTLLGSALSACGAAVLNQWWERDIDGLMKRTRNRPLPAGRMQADTALALGIVLSIAGVASLALLVNTLSAVLSAATIIIYVLVYTPLKRLSSLNTIVGAIPGALPPLIGWTASGRSLTVEAWVLFAILFLWQMPHFLAIAWMYREDYANAGFAMLSRDDDSGYVTARQGVIYTMALLAVSLLPAILHQATFIYFIGAFLLGAGFLFCAARFHAKRTRRDARILFFASILYLPLLLGLLIATLVR